MPIHEIEMRSFTLGNRSIAKLQNVHPDLVGAVYRAIELTTIDFCVVDGLRTLTEQQKYFDAQITHTMQSRHLTGHAIDLVPYINSRCCWELNAIYPVALAMRQAANELQVPLLWGGCWDRFLTSTSASPKEMLAGYRQRMKKAGKEAFFDGPHYELPEGYYP